MLINDNNNSERHVEFVSYTGEYPTLCSGILTLRIDGTEYTFGYDYNNYPNGQMNYPKFWSTGGSVNVIGNYEDFNVFQNEWQINAENIPEEFQQYAAEFDTVFNENVRWGCCGGCI